MNTNSSSISTNATSVGSMWTLLVLCGKGYLSDLLDVTLTCSETGVWSHTDTPSCLPVQCPNFTIANSNITGTGFGYLDSISVTCEYGYSLTGNASQLVCGDTAMWSSAIPECLPIVCAPPPELANGAVTRDGLSVLYSCNLGYRLLGDNTSLCNSDGVWLFEARRPSCIRVVCRHPGVLAHGQVYGRNTDVSLTQSHSLTH